MATVIPAEAGIQSSWKKMSLRATVRSAVTPYHCEERSDVAITHFILSEKRTGCFFLIIFMKIQKIDSFLYPFLFITKEICLMIKKEITNESNKRIFEFIDEWI